MKDKKKTRHSLRTKLIGINVSVTVASFILCGLLFVMSVGLLVGKYVNHDLDFLLQELSDNLNTKLSYMEDVVYEIRNSPEIMSFLTSDAASDEWQESLGDVFADVVNISGEKNQVESDGPVIDKVYLFREDEKKLSSFYYAMIYSEVNESDRIFEEMYRELEKQKEKGEAADSVCFEKKDHIYVTYPLLDNEMEEQGTVMFEMNRQAIAGIMKEISGYEGGFWGLYDEKQVLGGKNRQIAVDNFKKITSQGDYEPYIAKLGSTSYRMYRKALCMNLSVASGIPENQTVLVLYDSMHIYIFGIIIILLAGLSGFTVFTYKVTKPMQEVTQKMQKVQEGEFDTKLPDYDNEEFHEISQVFNEMTEYINHLVTQVYEKQLSIKEMELKFLQTQMNPHFMFNVLNSIALQARLDGQQELFRMISSFSCLIQAKIYRSGKEKVQIRQELEYVDYYLYLQELRYGDRLKYLMELPNEQILDQYIPKLCIQLIVENAVVHGIEPKVGGGTVEVHIYEKDNSIYIEIQDDGVGFETDGYQSLPIENMQEEKGHNHVGLNNVHHIIQLMYGEEYGITVFSNHQTGTKVTIHIPYDAGE